MHMKKNAIVFLPSAKLLRWVGVMTTTFVAFYRLLFRFSLWVSLEAAMFVFCFNGRDPWNGWLLYSTYCNGFWWWFQRLWQSFAVFAVIRRTAVSRMESGLDERWKDLLCKVSQTSFFLIVSYHHHKESVEGKNMKFLFCLHYYIGY